MKVKLLVFLFLFLLVKSAYANYVDTAWVRTYDGQSSNYDEANAIAIDDSGNVYVTGYSYGSGTNSDYATIKYLPNGDTAWVRRYNGPANFGDEANAIAVDGDGNVYVTGTSVGSATGFDFATIKYNSSGDTVWVRRYTEPIAGYDGATALAVDGSGNVYVTGYSYSASTEGYDYLTIKYQPNGDTAWIRRYNGSVGGDDLASALALDGSGNVYVTGRSEGGGVANEDYVTIKYNPTGDILWLERYDDNSSADRASVMASDASGNIYVTGLSHQDYWSEDIVTIKYYSSGDTAWVRRYAAAIDTGDYPRAIVVDGSGNVYVAGRSYDMATHYDYLIIKYLPNGDTAWVRKYDGPESQDDMVYDMALDASGNVYVTGASWGEPQNWLYATVKYDSTGKQVWAAQYDGRQNGDDIPHAVAVDQSNHVVVTGTSDWGEGAGGYNYATIKYLQYDSIPFAPADNYATGDQPYSVFCADLDGDGDLDLVVVNSLSNTASVLMNNGDGTFPAKVDYGVGDEPFSVFCADLDGDGDLDLTVANRSSGNISILRNNGNGIFQPKVDYGAGVGSNSIFCADLDGDGDMDLAVSNAGSNNISILKNNGDGTFQNKTDYGVGDTPGSIFCADLDGDGDLDLAVTNRNSNSVSILKNNGDGTFQPKSDYGTGEVPVTAFCADLDGDFDLDLAVANRYSENVSILRNNGNGTFQPKVDYGAGDSSRFVFCADLDGDGDLDLAVTSEGSDRISILQNNGNGTFQAKVDYVIGGGTSSVFCADLDGDGDRDIATTDSYSNGVSILKNLSEVPANQPPQPFSLISPANGDTIFGSATFRWHIPYDPNFGDQIKYDLYISTSAGFEPLFTIINDGLPLSKFNVVLDSGFYYWKVKAHDNWGGERWSSQTWSFESKYLDDTLRIIAFSPVDLIVKDPIGDSISLWYNTIPAATYDTTQDYNHDGDKDDIVTIPDRLVGVYQIEVVTEPGGSGNYELGIRIDGGAPSMLTMPGGNPCPGPGEVDTFTYNAPWYKSGDANGDWMVDVGDVVYLINYLYKSGSVPDPLVSGDATCNGYVDVGDVVFLINYLFKGGPAPSC
jgi:uncharacterized delta-60 repeat protein